MGNIISAKSQTCQTKLGQIIDESRIHLERINPFSKIHHQLPYAEPLEQNIFVGTQQQQLRLKEIMKMQPIKKPQMFLESESYEYDQKYWKKQSPNAVIQGHWNRRLPHGISIFYFPGGQRAFVAYFIHGNPIWKDCLVIFQDGAYYHGALENCKFHGVGKFVNANGSVTIEGEWMEGYPVGKVKETLRVDKEMIEFEGQFDRNGEKSGFNCSYTIKDIDNLQNVLFDYVGDFQNGYFIGESTITTSNGKNQVKAHYHSDFVQIKRLKAQEYQFYGKLDKNLTQGHGKFHPSNDSEVVYEGDILDGKLHGYGLITKSDNTIEHVYWYEGFKLKHLRNFQDKKKLKEMLHKIQEFFEKANTYTELTKKLAEHYKQLEKVQTIEGTSPRGQFQTHLFEIISKDKANNIVGASKNAIASSSTIRNTKNQLIVELQKGKFLYVCLKAHHSDREML